MLFQNVPIFGVSHSALIAVVVLIVTSTVSGFSRNCMIASEIVSKPRCMAMNKNAPFGQFDASVPALKQAPRSASSALI